MNRINVRCDLRNEIEARMLAQATPEQLDAWSRFTDREWCELQEAYSEQYIADNGGFKEIVKEHNAAVDAVEKERAEMMEADNPSIHGIHIDADNHKYDWQKRKWRQRHRRQVT